MDTLAVLGSIVNIILIGVLCYSYTIESHKSLLIRIVYLYAVLVQLFSIWFLIHTAN